MKINGHEHAVLVVPAHDDWCRPKSFTSYLRANPQTLAYMNANGDAYAYPKRRNGRATRIATNEPGGHSLRNPAGESVPYTGQSYLLSVPTWALSEKGKQAAAEFAEGRK